MTTLFAPALRTACRSEAMSATFVGVARRRVAGEAGFDVTYLHRRSERRAVRPILPLTLTLNMR